MSINIQIINNGNSITTVTYDGNAIVFEVNDKLDYKTDVTVENLKEIKFKPDDFVNEITFNKYEGEIFDEPTSNPLELIKDYAIKEGYSSVDEVKKVLGEKVLDVKITDDLVDKIEKDIGKYFKPVPLGYKWQNYRKKEIDKNRRLRKELKKARKKIAELKVKPESDKINDLINKIKKESFNNFAGSLNNFMSFIQLQSLLFDLNLYPDFKNDSNFELYKSDRFKSAYSKEIGKEQPKRKDTSAKHFKINENFELVVFKYETAILLNLVPLHWSKCQIKSFTETLINNNPLIKHITFFFSGKPDHKLKELIELNPNYKVEFF